MKAYGKTWRYNLYGCHHCLYWKGKKTGCTYENGCCAPVPQKPPRRNGVEVEYDQPEQVTVSECVDCPYGRDSPCIGWCTKEVMRSVGLLGDPLFSMLGIDDNGFDVVLHCFSVYDDLLEAGTYFLVTAQREIPLSRSAVLDLLKTTMVTKQ